MIHQAKSNPQLLDEQIFSERLASAISAIVKVCGCRPHEGGAAHTGGRRTQTSKGGNRGRRGEVARQTLWEFRPPRPFKTVFLEFDPRAAKPVRLTR